MKLDKNIIASIASSIWAAIIGLAVVPVYLHYLGLESYGLIGFFATLQSMLLLLDLGLAPTINREVARHYAQKTLPEAGGLLRTLAVLYWSVAGIIFGIIYFVAPLVAKHWLNSENTSSETLVTAITLMGFVAACRSPIGLYQGALIGAQRLSVSAIINIVMITIANGGAIVVLMFFSTTIEAFFIWQGIVAVVHTFLVKRAAWFVIGKTPGVRFSIAELRRTWKFAAGVGAAASIGLVFTQLDKVILSSILSLADFGEYSLARLAAGTVYILIIPVYSFMYARMSTLTELGQRDDLLALYRQSSYFFASVLFSITMALVYYSETFVYLWTGDQALSANIAPVIALLVLGNSIHGIMHFPYALQLAFGKSTIALKVNITLLILALPINIVLSLTYGLIGAASAWLIIMLGHMYLSTKWTHDELLIGIGPSWLAKDVGQPFITTLLVFTLGKLLLSSAGISFSALLAGIVFSSLLSILAAVYISDTHRALVLEMIWRYFGKSERGKH